MSRIEVVEKSLPAVRLAGRRGEVAEQPEIPAVIGPTFDAVADALTAAGAAIGAGIAEYDMHDAGVRFAVGFEHDGEPVAGTETVELPPVETALCATHLGTMARIVESWQALHDEVRARGFMPSGPSREVYLRAESEDQADWITELQQPVARA